MKSNVKKVETSCNNCGSLASEVVTTGCEHEYDSTTDDVFTVVRCVDCGLMYLNPRPDLSELSTIYPPNYYPYGIEERYDERQRSNLYYKLRYGFLMFGIERALGRFFPLGAKLKVLDIGCADGQILNLFAQTKKFKVETFGVDISKEAADKARAKGHTVITGRFEAAEFPIRTFDFVYASHVIEHVPDPKEFARRVFDILKPGGIFWFWTPNTDSLDFKLFAHRHWGNYCFPRHFVFYNTQTIKQLAGATNFDLVHIEYQPNGISWIYTFHSILKSNPQLCRYADLLFPVVDCSRTTLLNFLRNGIFVFIELVLKLFTGKTSNMGVAFRKPP